MLCPEFTRVRVINVFMTWLVRGGSVSRSSLRTCILINYIVGHSRGVNPYSASAVGQALTPYRPKTMAAYRRNLKLYLAYCQRFNIPVVCDVFSVLGFCEILYQANNSPATIANYLSGIKVT